jgi:hypothetical protein
MKSVYSPHRKHSAPLLFTPNTGTGVGMGVGLGPETPVGESLISDLLVAVGHLKVVFESNLCLGAYEGKRESVYVREEVFLIVTPSLFYILMISKFISCHFMCAIYCRSFSS